MEGWGSKHHEDGLIYTELNHTITTSVEENYRKGRLLKLCRLLLTSIYLHA
jgi:hypothetical protein